MPHTRTRTESCPVPPSGSRGIEEILAAARARLRRLDPEQAHLAYRSGALLVDIRPAGQRAAHGTVPGALAVERNVLEWRFDPRCPARLPQAVDYDVPVVILCQEGYTSSLAAAALQELGLYRATDVAGGFAAWRIAGLPTLGPTPPHRPTSAAPPVTAGRAPR
ncbi:rhodanese-related sulfurtransferase [Micromonospora kangleipakensis]|uniref:Rhodanese-related sulfurtransferase n=1 Tax=Micromonospora kangleipakensis TaxID=1077942 RepID=A0A4Q8BD37_9ACTN|nr:rhodanese-like domain-containing protein [Micromonospora kangleipakensis]RZU75195.1 rhodanese-related sulfurtransferase [Micromonospora kangleipakensis]